MQYRKIEVAKLTAFIFKLLRDYKQKWAKIMKNI